MTADLLETCIRKGIELSVESDVLRYRAPTGVMTPQLKDSLRASKAELIALLQAEPLSTLTDSAMPRDSGESVAAETIMIPYCAQGWEAFEWDGPNAVKLGLQDDIDRLFGRRDPVKK